MTNKPRVDPTKLIDALRKEHLRRKTWSKDVTVAQKASQAKSGQTPKGQPKPPASSKANPPVRHCTFCNLDAHDLNRCRNVASLIGKYKADQQPPKPKTRASSSSCPPAKAGRTSAAPLCQP
jgi:hypothetical protein